MKARLILVAALMASIPFAGTAAEDNDEHRDQLKASELPEYDQLRDPFWPIGYTRQVKPKVDPNAVKSLPDEVKPKEIKPKWPRLRLKAVTSSPKGFIAILEGIGLVEEGQIVKMTVDGIVYSWRVGKISNEGFAYKQLEAKAAKK